MGKAILARAMQEASEPLTPQEVAVLESAVALRPRGWLARFGNGMAAAAKVVTRAEFNRICEIVHRDLDGQPMTPWDACERARRLIEAYTRAKAGVNIAKCDRSETAILVAWLGRPSSGFLFQRALRLKDPQGGARRG